MKTSTLCEEAFVVRTPHFFAVLLTTLLVSQCAIPGTTPHVTGNTSPPPQLAEPHVESRVLINEDGDTLGERFLVPDGYERLTVEPSTFAYYLRNLSLKPHDVPVTLYDGRLKPNQSAHEAVLDIDTGDRDLQQCADAVIRLHAEYLWAEGRYDEIHYNFGNGFRCDYSRWMQGERVVVQGNDAYWVRSAPPSSEYAEFRRYLDIVFAYAYTGSLIQELSRVDVQHMQIGDVFIDQGHAIIVVDMAKSVNSDDMLFMLAQSYMPAQDIHVLKNPSSEMSPWYALDFGQELVTPEWTFTHADLRRFQ